jgi:hypothetical protein
VKAKKANPDLTDISIELIKTKAKLSETMSCYCSASTSGGYAFWKIFKPTWNEFDIEEPDENNYCAKWYQKFIYSIFINNVSEFTVIILNSAIAIVLQYLSEFLKTCSLCGNVISRFSHFY